MIVESYIIYLWGPRNSFCTQVGLVPLRRTCTVTSTLQQINEGTEKHFLAKTEDPRVHPPALSSIICSTFNELPNMLGRYWGYGGKQMYA